MTTYETSFSQSLYTFSHLKRLFLRFFLDLPFLDLLLFLLRRDFRLPPDVIKKL